jgi:hypothetical protein
MNDPIENDETELDLEEEPEVNHEVEKLETLMVSTETALKTLISLADRVKRNGTVDRVSANTIQTLTTGMESMESHFTKYPVASYTGIASTTNLAVTLEGLISTIAKAILEAIKAAWKFICESVTQAFKAKTRNREKFEQYQKSLPSANRKPVEVIHRVEPYQKPLPPATRNPVEVEHRLEQYQKSLPSPTPNPVEEVEVNVVEFSPFQKVILERLNSNQMALWIGASDTPKDFAYHPNVRKFLNVLFLYDCEYLEQLTLRWKKLTTVLASVTPGDDQSNGILETFLHQHAVQTDITRCSFYYSDVFYKELQAHRSNVERPGENVYMVMVNALAATQNAPVKLPRIESKEEFFQWVENAKKVEEHCRTIKSKTTRSTTNSFDVTVMKLNKQINNLIQNPNLTQDEATLVHAISKDIEFYVRALAVHDSLIYQAYTAMSIALQTLTTDWS